MKEFQIRVKDGSKATSDAMDLLSGSTQGVWKEFLAGNGTVSDVASTIVNELKGMEDQVMAGQIAVGLFGTKWEDLEADAMYAMLGTKEGIRDFQGAMESINEIRFNSVGKAIRGISRILFMELVYPIGDTALPYLNKFASFLSNNLASSIDAFKRSLIVIGPIILGIVSALAVYRGTLMAAAAAQAVFNAVQRTSIMLYNAHRAAMVAHALYGKGLTGIIHGMAAANRILNVSMLANPFVAVAAAIIGLGVAFYTAYKMSDTFREKVNGAFAAIQDAVANTISYISVVGPQLWNGFLAATEQAGLFIVSKLGGLKGAFGEFINFIKSSFATVGNTIATLSPLIARLGLSFLGVTGPVGWVIAAVVSLGSFLYKLINSNEEVKNSLIGAWTSAKSAIEPLIGVITTMGTIFAQMLAPAIAEFASSFAVLGPEFQKTGAIIKDSFIQLGPAFMELGAAFAELGSTLAPLIGEVFITWISLSTTLATTILPLLIGVVQAVFPMILSIIQAVLPLVLNLLVSIVPVILKLTTIVIPMILQVVQAVFPIVLSIIQAVLPVILQLISALLPIIMQLVTIAIPLILQVVQAVFPVVLTIIQTVIPVITAILQGVAIFITSVVVPAIQIILKVVQLVFPLIMTIVQNAIAVITGVMRTFTAVLQGDWNGAWNAIKQTAVTIMNNIIGFFRSINLFDVGKSIVRGLINGIKSMGGSVLGAIKGMIPAPIRGAASKLLGALPGFAEGGVISSPTVAWVGEGGDTETVIPWNNSKRSLDLWRLTGEKIGALNNGGGLGGPSPLAVDPSYTSNKSVSTITLQSSPTIVIQASDVDRGEVERQINNANKSTIDELNEWHHDQGRLSF